MARIAADVTELIGRTPLVRLNRVAAGLPATVVAKLESLNPSASVKDRIGVSMIEDGRKARQDQPGKTVLIEPTSGNTGIGAGLRRRRQRLPAHPHHAGDHEHRAPRAAARLRRRARPHARPQRHEGRHRQGQRDVAADPDGYMLQQFDNPANPAIHFETTGPEIWNDTDGKVDILISGVGTGGTSPASASTSSQRSPAFKAIAVEPTESPVLSGGQPGPHKIQGIGAGFVPSICAPT